MPFNVQGDHANVKIYGTYNKVNGNQTNNYSQGGTVGTIISASQTAFRSPFDRRFPSATSVKLFTWDWYCR